MSKDYSYWTVDEFLHGFRGLSPGDVGRLHLICRKYCNLYGLDVEPEDLMQEALSRIIASNRSVPKEIPLVVAMAKILHSIAYDLLTSSANKSLQLEDRYEDINDAVEVAAFTDKSVEDTLIDEYEHKQTSERVQLIFDLFRDDADVTALLTAIVKGYKAREIVTSVFGGQQVSYDTARKRLMRRIDKFHAEGVVT
jgi:DNA-directed RNA polymerase specialized sigma24 family protein